LPVAAAVVVVMKLFFKLIVLKELRLENSMI